MIMLLLMESVDLLKIAPPYEALLLAIVLLSILTVPSLSLKIPPPLVALLPEIMLSMMVRLPEFLIAPPKSLPAQPVRVILLSVRSPEVPILTNGKLSLLFFRAILLPFPSIVIRVVIVSSGEDPFFDDNE